MSRLCTVRSPLIAVVAALALAAPAVADECDCTFPPAAPAASPQLPGRMQVVLRSATLTSRLDMVALNPQPIPPGRPIAARLRVGAGDLVSLNPQPIPPGLPISLLPNYTFTSPFAGLTGGSIGSAQLTVSTSFGLAATSGYVALNPQPIPPGIYSVNMNVGALVAVG